MPLFSVGGLSTGIDTKKLVEQLMNAERAPARLVEQNRSRAQTRLNAIQTMNTKMLAVRDAMDAVKLSDTFKGRKAGSSNETVASATAGATAVTGSVTINVTALASAQQFASETQPTATEPYYASGGVFIRSAGAETDTLVEVTDYSLNGIATAINNANVGASAAIINDGTGFRLLVTSEKSGATNGIVTLSGDGDLASLLPGTGIMREVAPARNAKIVIGEIDDNYPDRNLTVETATNQTDQVIPGVTLNLKSLGRDVKIDITQNNGGAADAVQRLVDTLNDARTYFADNSKYDTATRRAGSLFNDYEVPRQLDQLEQQLTQSFGALTGPKRMSEIGLTIGGNGKYAFDRTVFASKLSGGEKGVASLFLAAGSAASVSLESLTKSVTGTLSARKSSLEDSITAFTDRIASIDARLEKRKAFYEAKFLQMEKLSAQYKSQGNALNGISGFNNSNSK